MLNCNKISCRKISLNFGLLFQNLIYIGNLSTLLQLIILNKAYYLEIKIGLINESHQVFSLLQPFWNSYSSFLSRKRENGGSLCIKHGTLSIVSYDSITLYHITSHSIMSYQMVFHPIILLYQIASPHIPSYYILLCPILSYPITSHQTTTYQIHHYHYHSAIEPIVPEKPIVPIV